MISLLYGGGWAGSVLLEEFTKRLPEKIRKDGDEENR